MSSLRQKLSSGVRFWERLRLYFNLWLACILLFHFLINRPYETMFDRANENALFALVALGFVANAIYCAAYLLDMLIQVFAKRENWKLFRLIVYWYGMLASGILMNLIAYAIFAPVIS